MPAKNAESPVLLPADDPRRKMIVAAIRKEKGRPDALIQILHKAQNMFGYLPLNVIKFISGELRMPPSRVYGVVTFYHFFSLKPKGDHSCLVCTGTACYVKGAQQLLDDLAQNYGIAPGDVTQDNQLGLETVRCLGACGLAPAVVYDNEIVAKAQSGDLAALINKSMGERDESSGTH